MTGFRRDGYRPKNQTITFKASKPKTWSHQDDLQAAIGKKIRIKTLDESDPIEGTLVAADQFSLKLSRNDSAYFSVYYKSSLTYFMVL